MKSTTDNIYQLGFIQGESNSSQLKQRSWSDWVRMLLMLLVVAWAFQPMAAKAEPWCGSTSDLENVIAYQEYAWWELKDAMDMMTDPAEILATADALNVLDLSIQALKAHLAENTGPCPEPCFVCGNAPCTCVTVCPICYSDPCICMVVCPVCYSNPCVCMSLCPVCYSNPCVCASVCPVCYNNPCSCVSLCPVCFCDPCICTY
ncbi:MAG: hypothetical protein K9N47_25855 [Prosthecobacter sp.]|uniref:hypothetical protein n=1 Tax=Prosthecobacter sp. TaxID=1965333 RepID=UPI002623FCC6|nr:hypothetical protein [Prosthecobacter sp.]MCF7789575.1 hypothetical protein [Prosthecobacter sp.]